MKKGVVGGGQKVGVLSFPFFFFSFLTGPAFLLAFFLTFVGAFFSLSMEKKREEEEEEENLSMQFFRIFLTPKSRRKKR